MKGITVMHLTSNVSEFKSTAISEYVAQIVQKKPLVVFVIYLLFYKFWKTEEICLKRGYSPFCASVLLITKVGHQI